MVGVILGRMAFGEGSDISSTEQFKAGSNVVVGS